MQLLKPKSEEEMIQEDKIKLLEARWEILKVKKEFFKTKSVVKTFEK